MGVHIQRNPTGIRGAVKMKGILPFAATWMDLESIVLSEISQRNTNTVLCHPYVESKK